MKKVTIGLVMLSSALFACSFSPSPSQGKTVNANEKSEANLEVVPKEASITSSDAKTGNAILKEDVKMTYRCDGFRPGLASEYIQVVVNDENKITAMYYWNTDDEKKMTLQITSQKFIDGEISALSGAVKFPGSDDPCKFSMLEQNFNLDCDGMFQEFEME